MYVGDCWIHEACQVSDFLGPNPVEPCASNSPPSLATVGAGEVLERPVRALLQQSLALAQETGTIIRHRSSVLTTTI